MPPTKRLAPMLALVILAAPATAAPIALGQGAGDQQGPFAQQDDAASAGEGQELTEQPRLDLEDRGGEGQGQGGGGGRAGAGDAGGGTQQERPAAGAGAAAGTLPNTGGDPWTLAALGAALALCGVGLRLRTIDEDAY